MMANVPVSNNEVQGSVGLKGNLDKMLSHSCARLSSAEPHDGRDNRNPFVEHWVQLTAAPPTN